jgi:hypothetical protein
VFKSAADDRLYPIGQPAYLRSIRSRNKLNGIELFIWVLFHSGITKIADGSIQTVRSTYGNNNNISMARAHCRANQASEQALAHLVGCHEVSRAASSSFGFPQKSVSVGPGSRWCENAKA